MATLAAALPTLAMAGSAAGTAVSALSQMQAGRYAEAAGDAANKAAKSRAKQMFSEGRERASRMRSDNERRLSSIRARMAAGGTAISGSALDFMEHAAARLETRVQDSFRQSAIGANNELYSGQIAQMEGRQRRTASTMRGFGTLLEGVGAFYKQGVDYGPFQPKA